MVVVSTMKAHDTTPGATAFTRMPSAAYSIARCRVIVSRPPFMIIGTDLDTKELPAGLTLPELQAKLDGHVKGAAGLVGLFVKP